MEKGVTSWTMVALLLASMLSLALNIQPVEGWTGTVYIRASGAEPPDGPISSFDNVTYALVESIFGSIVVERDDIVIDGAGYTVQGTGVEFAGMDLSGRTNVTVQNMRIKNFKCGIGLHRSSGNSIIRNDVTTNEYYGIMLDSSSSNIVSGNNITANQYGVELFDSSNYNNISGNNIANSYQGIIGTLSSFNNVSGNSIRHNDIGIGLFSSSYNSFSGNNIIANDEGIVLSYSNGNRFHHNYFIYNNPQVNVDPSGYANIWDSGYPSGGNYWSDYVGTDENKDGTWDTAYMIDTQNVDHYPLVISHLVLDTEPPTISIISPYYGEVIRSPVVTISWEGTDYASGISHYTIAVDDGYSISVGLNTSYTFTELDDGQHVVRVVALDNAGNAAYQSVDFAINAGVRFAWPPYMAEAVVTIAIVIALGAALYVLKSKYSFRIKKPSRKLIR